MHPTHESAEIAHILEELHHYLPAQAPLKDFIHHNTLHAFQDQPFRDALRKASAVLGYKTSLSLAEYRQWYAQGKISPAVLDAQICRLKGDAALETWRDILLHRPLNGAPAPRIGRLRAHWKHLYQLDMDALVHPILFRLICSFLDQGIAIWEFPVTHLGFLDSVREFEKISWVSLFRTQRARKLLLEGDSSVAHLLGLVVGPRQALYRQYLFDQQFSHQGWSGMVATVEQQPETLLDSRKISLEDLIRLELLLELDALEDAKGAGKWKPMGDLLQSTPSDLLAEVPVTWESEAAYLWQEALEWTYYDPVLRGIQLHPAEKPARQGAFQALFCIDDRYCSLRRYLEQEVPGSSTYGTPGFFGVAFYFQPEGGKFVTKLCPAPQFPKYLIRAEEGKAKRDRDLHLNKGSHGLARGWLISQTLGFWSALRLFIQIFRPSMSPAATSSFRHMDAVSRLTIEYTGEPPVDGRQVGFTQAEMADRVEGLLRSIGLVKDFAPLVYVIGHGSSSVNNPHYAAYDCGACSGRPGSVNARVVCFMANHPGVRALLAERGIDIPEETRFLGGLHDTTRDEIQFYDAQALPATHTVLHQQHQAAFDRALALNAVERSRRLVLVNSWRKPQQVLEAVRLRSVSLFEPRPELNHATNALCIVGRRCLTEHLFLDRRAFMNSYDYRVDPEGKYLAGILGAVAPVCGGINLEYYFSRVDPHKLGAGTKLPHNVMGLFGVANGIDGDLRPGLPEQMIEVHDPVRLLVVVEHHPEVVMRVMEAAPATWDWFRLGWVHLCILDPDTKELWYADAGTLRPYTPLCHEPAMAMNLEHLVRSTEGNLPVYLLPRFQ